MLTELHTFATSSAFTPDERLVLRLADALTSTPADVSMEMFEELQSIFTDAQIVELSSAIAWENYRARFNRVFDAESQDFSHGASCPMPVRSVSQ